MARGVNKVILVGNLGDDPETKYTQGGMAVTSVSMATSATRKDRDGNQTEYTEWHRLKFFGKLAEIAGEYLKKGSQCYVEGRIHYDQYTTNEGEKRFYTDIVVEQMQMLGGRGDGGGGGQQQRGGGQRQQGRPQSSRPQQQQSSRPQRQEAPAQRDYADDFADDDIPF